MMVRVGNENAVQADLMRQARRTEAHSGDYQMMKETLEQGSQLVRAFTLRPLDLHLA